MKHSLTKFTVMALTLFLNLGNANAQAPNNIAKKLKHIREISTKYDDSADSVFNIINNEINNSTDDPVANSLWHIFMSNFLNSYKDDNSWKLRNRTTIADAKPEDFKEWSLANFETEVSKHTILSIKEKKALLNTPAKDFTILFQDKNEIPKSEKTTLYDILGTHIIGTLIATLLVNHDYESDNNLSYNDLWNNSTFLRYPFIISEKSSKTEIILSIYQDLTNYHTEMGNFTEVAKYTLSRFDFLRLNSLLNDESNRWYINHLSEYKKTLPTDATDCITFKIANLYNDYINSDKRNSEETDGTELAKALALYEELAANSKSEYYTSAKENIKEIKKTEISLSNFKEAAGENKNSICVIEYRNTKQAFIRIYKLSKNQYKGRQLRSNLESILTNKPVYNENIALPEHDDYLTHSKLQVLPKLDNGAYALLVSVNGVFDVNNALDNSVFFQISDLNIETSEGINNTTHVLVTDKISGEPISGVGLTYKDSENNVHSCKTDASGIAALPSGNIKNLEAKWKSQVLFYDNEIRSWYNNNSDRKNLHIRIFTDRNIYRPGQKVFYKGVLSSEFLKNNSTESIQLLQNETVIETLFDANSQIIKKDTLVTNEFGSVNGVFELPETGNTGSYRIEFNAIGATSGYQQTKWFNVEEYKRPVFEVRINEVEDAVKLNQHIDIEGIAEAFAGYPVTDATVSYSVTRSTSYPWWRWYSVEPDKMIAKGTTTTDKEGRFVIGFTAESGSYRADSKPLFVYKVEAVVSDINGETHSATYYLKVSELSTILNVEIPEEIVSDKSDNKFPITITNLYDKPQSGKVLYSVFRLTMPDKYLYSLPEATESADVLFKEAFPYYAYEKEDNKENWPANLIFNGDISLNKDKQGHFSIHDLQNLDDGYYKIVLKTQDPSGDWIEENKIVHIYNSNSKKCSGFDDLWSNIPSEANAGEDLVLEFGSYLDNANILCEVFINNNPVHSKWYKLNKEKNTVSIPVDESQRGQIKVVLYTISNNFRHCEMRHISIVNRNRDINFEFLKFRDKTRPGSHEEYQLRATDSKGNPVSAEVLCTMYDCSLDALKSGNFLYLDFPITFGYFNPSYNPITTSRVRNSGIYSHHYTYPYFYSIPYFYGSFYYLGYENEVVLSVCEDRVDYDADVSLSSSSKKMAGEDARTSYSARSGSSAEVMIYEEPEQVEPVMRTNFNETAFFYPEMRTDKDGNLFISYTIPDALTKWRLQGVAHTKDLLSGKFMKVVQTSKDVMVVPNPPRFLREGDTMLFSAKVVNTTGSHLCGYVSLEFFNPADGNQIDMVIGENHRQYDIEAGASQALSFKLAVPKGFEAATYRIIAHNTDPQGFADDGEEKTLPILPNRMLVTETMPFYISGAGSKDFTFNKLEQSFRNGASETLENRLLTIECTPNPVWYAILSLPYMMEYPYDCNEQKFSRYYANALATHILKSNPSIEKVFREMTEESPDAFCSALEKNQELKQVLLEETPWVLDAQREGANKQNLALLFDFKRMSNEASRTIKQLKNAQNNDGGWPWFDKGQSSDFITTHIVAGFGHLNALGVSTKTSQDFLDKAISYIDAQMYKRYLERKKYNIKGNFESHYLYARSFHKKTLLSAYSTAYQSCYNEMIKNWKSESFYTQAMIALTAWRNGDKANATAIVKYLKSMAQHDEENGMFWKRQGSGLFWYEQPIERQAMLIEAFNTITPEDTESINEMQLWLLKQKQTQNWGSTKATTEAVYALLLNNVVTDGKDDVTLKVGNTILPDATTEQEKGTGYFKKSWTPEEISADKVKITINKKNDGPAWGGMYWQYFEDLDKISASDDKNLIIDKDLFIVKNTDNGEVLQQISKNQQLRVGDKVRVRIVITTDRDMEYVHLKDQRAAAFEPVNVLSSWKYQDGLWYYESTKDASTNFFIENLRKGKYVFEYTLFATQSGSFSNGITQIECMYAPEFQSHTKGSKIEITR